MRQETAKRLPIWVFYLFLGLAFGATASVMFELWNTGGGLPTIFIGVPFALVVIGTILSISLVVIEPRLTNEEPT